MSTRSCEKEKAVKKKGQPIARASEIDGWVEIFLFPRMLKLYKKIP